MKKIILFFVLFLGISLAFAQNQSSKTAINQVMDAWHLAASKADFKAYFDLMDKESIFIGTDATERWNKQDFMVWAKPYFDKGKAWSFTSLERHITFSADGKTAWLDELLNTQMKICRGSGVLEKKNGKWLIKHYVLSMTVPNDLVDTLVPLKAPAEDKIIDSLKSKNK